MILLEARLRRIMQRNHMPSVLGDEILARLRLGEQSTRLRLRTAWPVPARSSETEDVVTVPGNNVHGRRRGGCLFQPCVYA